MLDLNCLWSIHDGGGRCQAQPDNLQKLHAQQPSTYKKPEAASAVLGSS